MKLFVYITSLLISISVYSQGPVAYYTFDNNSNDFSGNHNEGNIHGNIKPSMDRFGNPCGAYEFDGSSSYIEVPNSSSLESISKAFTVSVWYRFSNSKENTWLTVLCKGMGNKEAPANPQYRCQVQQNRSATINSCNNGITDGSATVSVNTSFTECDPDFMDHLFETDKWNFYVLVYDGSTVKAYMNAMKVFEQPYSGGLSANKSPLFIGMDDPGNTEYFEGHLDDLKLFNRALNEQEITALNNESRSTDWSKEEFEFPLLPDLSIVIPAGELTANITFTIPQAVSSKCGSVSVKQIAGPRPGDEVIAGKYIVTFEAVSGTGYQQNVSFYIVVKGTSEVKPAATGDLTVFVTAPDYPSRENNELKFIEVKSTILQATIYDNGMYDGDTITLFLNDSIILSKQEVNPKGKSFIIQLDTAIDNILTIYANNLGSIVPNTALLILYDGTIRHEINLLSTLKSNGTIRIRRRKLN